MSRALAILGPTASGKSEVALELAKRLPGEVVSADALQAYRGFSIGTAKPSAEQRRVVWHHLLDILDPHEVYSAGRFARLARQAADEIRSRGRWVVIAGGSGLYLRALLEGISPLPAGDLELRDALRRRLADEGLPALRDELARLDPETARRLEPNDTQRTLRALEVALGSGRPLSAWLADRSASRGGLPALRVGLTLPRALLYDRISIRIARMIEAGWVEEVARLLDRGLSTSLPAFQAIGYRQIARYLRGGISLEGALENTLRATRRYAKRQETWFRRDSGIHWIPADETETALAAVLELLKRPQTRWVHG